MEPVSTVTEAWLDFAGSLHPALVHFPIALAVVAAAVELWRALVRREGVSGFSQASVRIAAVAAVLAATSGWMTHDAREGAPSGDIFLHRWVGILAAAALVALALTAARACDSRHARAGGRWRAALLATALCVGGAGSLGGDLVHGEGHITDALWRAVDATERGQRADAEAAARVQLGAPAAAGAPEPGSSPVTAEPHAGTIDYATQVEPLLKARCYECHGNGKKKGGVRLDDLDRVTRERNGEWVVKPGDPDASLLMRFVTLPADDEDRMPPEGDLLNAEEVKLLRDWIAEGARGAVIGTTAAPRTDPGWVAPDRAMSKDEQVQVDAASAVLAPRGILLRPLWAGSGNLELDLSRATPPAGEAELARLAGIAGLVVSLNAERSAFTDASATEFVPFTGLHSVRLDFTAAGDATARVLARMPRLHTANFVGTPLTDAGLAALARSPSLRRVYAWSSAVTPAGVEAAVRANPGLRVIVGD